MRGVGWLAEDEGGVNGCEDGDVAAGVIACYFAGVGGE